MAGLIFGLGLAISQMTNPKKVIAFLDVTGNWDPSLVLVLVSAVLISFLGFRLASGRSLSLLGKAIKIPTRRDLDGRLLVGAAIFGVGWGLGGYCPGPALASLTSGSWEPIIFVAAMLLGSFASAILDKKVFRQKQLNRDPFTEAGK